MLFDDIDSSSESSEKLQDSWGILRFKIRVCLLSLGMGTAMLWGAAFGILLPVPTLLTARACLSGLWVASRGGDKDWELPTEWVFPELEWEELSDVSDRAFLRVGLDRPHPRKATAPASWQCRSPRGSLFSEPALPVICLSFVPLKSTDRERPSCLPGGVRRGGGGGRSGTSASVASADCDRALGGGGGGGTWHGAAPRLFLGVSSAWLALGLAKSSQLLSRAGAVLDFTFLAAFSVSCLEMFLLLLASADAGIFEFALLILPFSMTKSNTILKMGRNFEADFSFFSKLNSFSLTLSQKSAVLVSATVASGKFFPTHFTSFLSCFFPN